MNPLYLIFFTFLLCFTSQNKLQAQEISAIDTANAGDFLITVSGDTLRGKMVTNWSDYIEFKVDGNSKKFETSEAKQCTTASGETYIRAYVPGASEMDFMKVLEKGKIGLYEHLGVFPITAFGWKVKTTHIWYASRGKEGLVKIKIGNSTVSGRFKKNLLKLVSGDPEITKLVNPIDAPTAEELRTIIGKFNARNK